jgi:transcriptional regulator with XRE-family HTH domain
MLNERLKNLRLAKGLTLQQVGDVFGISRASVSSWESGINQPDPRKLEKLADLFGASVNYLVTGQNQGLSEHASHGTNNLKVPFISWSNLLNTQHHSDPIEFVQCLYVTPSNKAFATRYIGSTSLEWQPSHIPAGAIIVADPSEKLSAGKHALVSLDSTYVEVAQLFKSSSKSGLGLHLVNSKLTKNLDKTVKVIGVIQEWRIGGKL